MAELRCPTCGGVVDPRIHARTFPFCRERCRAVDLGNWLDERYSLGSDEAPIPEGSGEE